MAKQHHRPSLDAIQQIIMQQLAMPANQNVPQYWTNRFFREPRRPRPPPDTENVNNIDPYWDYVEGDRLG